MGREAPGAAARAVVTFEALSYVVDVYRRHTPAAGNPVHVAFHLSFFPHLIAGPILRFADIAAPLPRPTVTLERLDLGISRFINGLLRGRRSARGTAASSDAQLFFRGDSHWNAQGFRAAQAITDRLRAQVPAVGYLRDEDYIVRTAPIESGDLVNMLALGIKLNDRSFVPTSSFCSRSSDTFRRLGSSSLPAVHNSHLLAGPG